MNLLLNLSKRIKRIRVFFPFKAVQKEEAGKKAEYFCTVVLQIHTLSVISHKFSYVVKMAIPTPAKLASYSIKNEVFSLYGGEGISSQGRFLPTMQ